MKFIYLMVALLFFAPLAEANVSAPEIHSVLELLQSLSVNEVSHLFLDLDDTLVEPREIFGSPQWFAAELHRQRSLHQTQAQVLEAVDQEWVRLQNRSSLRWIEEGMASEIQRLLSEGVEVLGFTKRNASVLSARTITQLAELGTSFGSPAFREIRWKRSLGVEAVYESGILFAGYSNQERVNSKGEVLELFLEDLNVKPRRLIFVDDKLIEINSVGHFLAREAIPSAVFHYERALKCAASLTEADR